MNRAFFITVHTYLSAFFAPVIFLVAISGGLYLVGVKGSVETSQVLESNAYMFNRDAADLKREVDALLATAGAADFDYEYVKVKGNTLYTRPTSKLHYVIQPGDVITVSKATPSLQNALLELHKGHGPTAFKMFQRFFAVGMLLIVVSGLWLGLNSPRLLPRTLTTSAVGTAVLLALVLM